MTTGNPAFCLFLYLTGAHFRGELQHNGDVSELKIKCWPIRIRKIGGVRLSDGLKTDYRWIIWKIGPVILFQKKLTEKDFCHAHTFSSLDCHFSFCIDLHRWWLLKVQKWIIKALSKQSKLFLLFIFWFKGLSLKTQIKIEFWRPVNGRSVSTRINPWMRNSKIKIDSEIQVCLYFFWKSWKTSAKHRFY